MAAVVIAASVILHAGLGADRWSRLSLFVDRPLVAAAIDQREPRWLGERRTGARQDNQGITVEAEAFASAEATDDLKVVEYLWMLALDRFSSFDVTVEHGGGAAAWLDLRFVIGYRDQAGRHLATSEIVVKQILHPGDRRTWTQVPDRNAPPGAASASLALVGAEKVQPWIRPQE